MNESAILDRAIKAKALIENPMYDESFEMVKKAIYDRIESTPMADKDAAEDLRKCLKLLRDVKANLTISLESGKLVQFDIVQAEQRRKNPLKGLFR